MTPTTTTGPPPRPGGNSGRCACPEPATGSAGTAGTLPTFTHRPVGRVGAQLYPGGIAARYRNTARGLARPSDNGRARRPPSEQRDRASQQPIAASFGAAVLYRGFNHWFDFPTPFCLASGPGPLAADRCYIVGAAPAPSPTSGLGLPPASPGRYGGRGWASHPTRLYGASWRTADLINDQQRDPAERGELMLEPTVALGVGEPSDPLGRGREAHAMAGRQAQTANATARCVLPVPASSSRTTHCVDSLPERVRLVHAPGGLRGRELAVLGWSSDDDCGELVLLCRLVDGSAGEIPARWTDLQVRVEPQRAVGGVASTAAWRLLLARGERLASQRSDGAREARS